MKKVTLLSILFILFLVATSFAAGPIKIKGIQGRMSGGVGRSVNFSGLPALEKPRLGGPKKFRKEVESEEDEVKMPPPDISSLTNVTLAQTSTPGGNGLMAPVQVGTGFEGISQGGYLPTEPSPAAGPYNIFTGGNSSVVVINKDGTHRVEVDGDAFFGAATAEGGISDLVCMYDARHGHFVACCFTTDASTYSWIYFAVSKTNDARGDWWTYRMNAMVEGTNTTTNWADYQKFGICDDKIVMSDQQFTAAGSFAHQRYRVWDLTQFYSGNASTFSDIIGSASSPPFVTIPARNLSAGTTIYLLNVSTGGGSTVTPGTITGTAASPSLLMSSAVSVQTYGATAGSHHTWSGGANNDSIYNCVVGGSTKYTVSDGDCRLSNLCYRNGYIYGAFHFGTVISPDTVDAVRFLKLNTSGWSVATDETYAAGATWMYYPCVSVDSVGTVFLGFGRSSKTEYPSCYVTGKRRNDGSLQASALAKAGVAVLSTSYTRWGDYTATDMDETMTGPGGSYAWYVGQATQDANDALNWVTLMNFPYSQVRGHVYLDLDASAITTTDRRSLSGWTVTLKQGINTVATTTTDANGGYSFGYMESGTYTVNLTPQAGNTVPLDVVTGTGGNSQTEVDNVSIQISVTSASTAQTSMGNDFLLQYQNATIDGYVYNDLNANGALDAGEGGLSGWTINLTGTASASTTTDATGYYSFNNLATGSYTVSQVSQAGYSQTAPVSGSYSLTITSATQQVTGQNFGDYRSTTKLWTGGASTSNWGDAANWSPAGVPGLSNDVNITDASTININVAASCNNFLLQNASAVVTIQSGNALTVGGNFTLAGGTFNTQGAFPSVSGTKTISSGTVGYTAASGSQTVAALTYQYLVIAGGGTKSFAGSTTVSGDLSINSGVLNMAGQTFSISGALTVANGATLQTGGTPFTYTEMGVIYNKYANLTLGSSSTVDYSGGAETMMNMTYGNLTVSGSGTKTLSASVMVSGVLTLNQTITTGGYTLSLGSAGSVVRSTGYVIGSFAKTLTGTGLTNWETGTSAGYLPMSLNVSAITGSGPVTVLIVGNKAAKDLGGDTTKSIGHYYTVTSDPAISSLTAIPKLDFTLAEFNVLTGTSSDQTKLFLARSSAGIWVSQRTTSTLSTTAASGVNGNVTLTAGTTSLTGSWGLFWGTTDAPLSGTMAVKTWIGNGASGGNSSTDFNAAANWSPAGTPGANDSCVMLFIDAGASGTFSPALTAPITIGSLYIKFIPTVSTGTGEAVLLTTNFDFTIKRVLKGNITGSSTLSNSLQMYVYGGATVTVDGNVYAADSSTASAGTVWFGKGLYGALGTWVFRGDSCVFGAKARTSAVNIASEIVFDGPGTQYLSVARADTLFNWPNITIGRVNTPTLIIAGNTGSLPGPRLYGYDGGNSTAGGSYYGADLKINAGCTLDLPSGQRLNHTTWGNKPGTLTLGAGAKLRIGGTTSGVGTSNFPLGFTTASLDPTSTVEYYGTSAQTVNGTLPLGSLVITGAATRTDSLTTTVRGNFTINTGATFAANSYTLNLAGSLTDNGTFNGQSGTVILNGTAAQSIGGTASPGFNNLTISNSTAPISLSSNMDVAGTFSLGAGSVFSPSATSIINNAATAGTISGSGAIQVTGSYASQYKFTTNTLTNMTLDYAGPGAQTIAAVTCLGLKTSGSGTKTLGGAITINGPLTIGTSTTLDASATNYSIGVTGAWTNNGTFTPRAGMVTLNGSSTQTIGGTASSTFNSLTISNTGGATLGASASVSGTLTLGANKIATGTNTLSIGTAGSLSRTTGYVNGILQKYVNTGAATPSFEIGDASNYTPIAVAFGSVTTGGTLTAKTVATENPNIATSTINSSKSVNRYWNITNSGVAFNNYSATFTYVAGDVDAGATPTAFSVAKYDAGTWTVPTLGTVTSTSAQASGMTSFSDFAIGLTYTAGDNPSPLVTSLSPPSINAGTGATVVTVNGTGFIASSTVAFRGTTYTTTYVNATQLTVSIPAAPVANGGLWPVTVTNPTPGGGTSPAFNLTVNHLAPTTTSISPTTATVYGTGYTLTVNGTNFDSSSVVQVSGSSRTTTFISTAQLTAAALASDIDTAGTFNVTVFASTPGGGTSGAQTLAVNNPIAAVTSTSPASSTGGGSAFTLTLNGANFVYNSVVSFNGIARTTTFVNSTQVTVPILASDIQIPGTYPITVFNPTPGGGTSSAYSYTVTVPTGVTRTWAAPATGGDFNAASSWSPSGIPTVSDSCYMPMTTANGGTVTLSSSITVRALNIGYTGTNRTFTFDPQGNTLTIAGGVFTTTSNSSSGIIAIGTASGSTAAGTIICQGPALLGNGSTGNTRLMGNSNSRFIFKGNVTLGARIVTVANQTPGQYLFDGTGTQTVTFSNASAINVSNVVIGSSNSPTVVRAGTGTVTVDYDITVDTNSTLDLGTVAFNRTLANNGAINLLAGSTLRLGGTTGGQTGSNFPSNFIIFNFDPTSTVEYYAATQTIFNTPSYGHLTLSTAGTKTAGGALSISGNLTINTGATFAAGTSLTHTLGGNFTNNGTFSFTTANTMVFAGTGAQTIGGSTATTFYNLTDTKTLEPVTLATSTTISNALTLSSGPFAVGNSTLTLNGLAIAGTPASLTTTSGSTLIYGGSATGLALPSSVTALSGLTLNNTNGLTLNSSPTVSGVLTLGSANITTGSNILSIGPSGSISRSTGMVVGNLRKTIPTGSAVTATFEIGGTTGYRPVNVTFGSVSTGGTLTATVTTAAGNHPNIGTSGFDPTKTVQRYWTLTNGGIAFDSYNVTMNYLVGDYSAGTPANFLIKKYNGTWAATTPGTRTTTSTQATGVTSFSDFVIGEGVTYTITASVGSNGSISPSGSVPVSANADQPFTITPNTGYHVADVLVDGGSVGAVTNYSFTNVTGNHTISASFAINTYTITATAAANGSISPSGAVVVNSGSGQTFTIAANTGYHIDSVTVDGVSQGAVASYPFTNVTANHSINAYFSINSYTITATAAANGTITPSGAVSVLYGGSQSFAIAANANYHIDSVKVDGVNQGAITSYPFTNVTANHTINAYFSIDQITITATSGSNGSITPSGSVSINYGANQTFNFTPTTGYHVDSLYVDGVSQTVASSYTFNTVTAGHTIRVTFAINQYTITASAGANGSISPTGVATVNYNGSQFYSFTPSAGYHVDSLIVDGVLQTAAPSYNFAGVTANHTIRVTFAIDQYTLTASAGSNGSISPLGSVVVNGGASQLFTFTPSTGYHLDSLVVDGAVQTLASSYQFDNIASNHTIRVTFAIDQFTISASSGANGSINPSGSVNVNYGANQAFNFTAGTGYHVDSLYVDGVSQAVASSFTFNTVTAGHTIRVTYAINQYTITASAGANGSISPTGVATVNYNGSQFYSFTPSAGYHVDSLIVDGVLQTAVPSYNFANVSANHTIRVTFAIDQFTITATAGSNGTISPSGSVKVDANASQLFTFTPATGYHVDSLVVDGAVQTLASSYQFDNVSTDHTIRVAFAIDQFTITATSGSNGSISPSGTVSVNYGGSQAFNFTPGTGYHVDSLYVDGVSQSVASSYTFNNVTAGHTIRVTFVINQYTITASAGANGSISPTGVATVNYNGSQFYSFTPSANYHIDSLIVDGVSQTVASSYNFTGVTANHTIRVTFAIDQFTITASAGTNGTISPSGSVKVDANASQLFTFTPSTGYHVDSLIVDGAVQTLASSYQFDNVSTDHTIRVAFAIDQFTITATSGSNGSISPSGSVSVNYGGSQAFNFTAGTGYHVDSLYVDGVSQSVASSYTFTNVTAGHTIRVTFAIDQFTISSSAGANGNISPLGAVSVNHDGSQTFTITPATGYHVDSLYIDGVSEAVTTSYTFNNVGSNHTIRATFAVNTYTITANAGANGTITPSGSTTVNYGDSVSYAITPIEGYHVSDVVVDGISIGPVTEYTFRYIADDHTIEASFTATGFTITATAGTGGTISPSGGISIDGGNDTSFTITANTGFHIDSVFVDGVSIGAVSSYSFTNVVANHTIRAKFAINTFVINASAGANGSISPSGAVSVNYDASQNFTFTPSTGYHVDSLIVDGAVQAVASSYQFTHVLTTHTIRVTFAINQFNITASAGSNGTIDPTGSNVVNYGGSQSYTLTPATGYHVDSLVVDGVAQTIAASYTFSNVTANHTIRAAFAINTFTVTTSAGANGAVAPLGTRTVNYGDNLPVTITPNTGYHVADVLVDGSSVGAVTSYTFNTVTANHTLSATFAINTFSITATSSANGTISPSGAVSVNYNGSQNFTFTPSTGYHVDTLLVDGVIQAAAPSYLFSAVTVNHTIYVSFAIDQFVITASSGANGTIAPSGTVNLNYGANQTFNLTPSTGYHVDSLVVDGVAQAIASSYTFNNVTANHTIRAAFAINTFTVTTSAGANGAVAPLGTRTVNYGDNLPVTITPNTGYHVADVLVDGSSIGAVTSYTFNTVTANHTLSATFAINTFSITASAGLNGTISPSGAVSVNYNGSQNFTFTPSTGYHVDTLLVDGVIQAAAPSYLFSAVTVNHTIYVSFAIDQFVITASSGANGTIAPSGTVNLNYGANQTFNLTPSTGYHVDSLVVDGVAQTIASSYTFNNVTANHTIRAAFAIKTFTVTTSAGANGAVTPLGTRTVNYGDNLPVTITPNTGYHVADVLVDGSSVGAVTSYEFTTVTANHTLSATFAINTFSITASAGENGTITPSGSVPVNYNGSQNFTFTPATGYHIDSFIVDGVAQTLAPSYLFSGVTGNHTISVSFAIDQFTITASAGANGTIAPEGTIAVSYGGSQNFTFTPGTGYHVDSLVVDGIVQPTAASYQFTNVTANHTMRVAFAIDRFTIVASTGTNGSMTPLGTISVNYNGSQAFALTPSAGYHVDTLLVDGVQQPAAESYTFNSVTANHTIYASFAINTFAITVTAGANGSVTPSGTVGVNYNASQLFAFTPATGYHVDSLIVDGVALATASSYQFSNVTADHSLRVTFAINMFTITAATGAHGTVTPAGITNVSFGSTQGYAITPATGYHVDSLFIDGVSAPAQANYSFTDIQASHTIRAVFAINAYTVTLTAGTNGTVMPSGVQSVNYGDSLVAAITPATGYHIADVLVDGVSVGTVTSYTFRDVTAGHTLSASFAITTFTITASSGPNGTITPSGNVSVNYGATQAFAINPATGYHIDSLVVDGINLSIAATDTFKNVTANHTIRVAFKINTYTITATSGANGAIAPTGIVLVTYGANQAFSFTPATGYHIDSVFIDGAARPVATADTFFNITADHAIRVVFAINTYAVTATAGPHGTISPVGAVVVAYGSDQTFSIHPAIGYHIDTLKVDDAVVTADTSYSFANVTVAHSIAVSFAINTYTIEVSVADEHGSITPSGVVTVNYGSDAPFSILPSSGYKVDSLYIDGVSQVGAVTYAFAEVSSNHTISASFTLLASYQKRYRTFPYDSLIVAKSLKKKAYRDYFRFHLTNTTGHAVTEINIVFGNNVTQLVSGAPFASVAGVKKAWKLSTGSLADQASVDIEGYSPVAKPQTIAKLWLGPVSPTPNAIKMAAQFNQAQLPMPNVANVRDYLYTNALQAHGGLVVGLVRTDSSKYLGWVRMKKSGDLYKSLTDKSGPHTTTNHGFVTLTNGKAFVKELTSLPPLKQNDRTFADLMALKFNIALSALGVTEGGFGELMYTEAGNPFAGMLVRDIALTGDSMMTLARWQKWSNNAALYGNLDVALQHINGAFAGSIDTVSWGSGLQLTGTVRLIDAGILSATGIAPAVMAQAVTEGTGADADVPEQAMLYQNYPNPFNPVTTIKFDLPEDAMVSLTVYNMLGQQVATVLERQSMSAGSEEVRFDAGRLSSGVYFYRINVDPVINEDGQLTGRGFVSVKKMLLVK